MIGQAQLKKEIAARLKQAREAAGYTTAEAFCEKHNISLNEYREYENGVRAIKASYALEYCKFLNVSFNWLLLGEVSNSSKNMNNHVRPQPEA